MMDLNALFKMHYGLYIISALHEGQAAGCVVNTLTQVTAEPPRLTLAIHKNNHTTDIIRKSGRFAAVALAQECDVKLIGLFGFRSSLELNKFERFRTAVDTAGVPYVCEQVVARYSCKVEQELDADSHVIFLGSLEESEILDPSAAPLTYAYYHEVKKGNTPKNASSYRPPVADASGS